MDHRELWNNSGFCHILGSDPQVRSDVPLRRALLSSPIIYRLRTAPMASLIICAPRLIEPSVRGESALRSTNYPAQRESILDQRQKRGRPEDGWRPGMIPGGAAECIA